MKLLLARLVPFICVALGVEHVDKATDLVNGWNGIAAALLVDAILHYVRTHQPRGIFYSVTRVLKACALWIGHGGLRRISRFLFSIARFAEALANYSDKVIPQRLKESPTDDPGQSETKDQTGT